MKIKHSAITSPVFELIKTVEVDLTLVGETWPTRFEIFRHTERPDHFRCRVWQLEHYRIQSTFPQSNGRPAHEPSDQRIMVDWSHHLPDTDDFVAADVEAALGKVMKDFRNFLEHTTGEK